MVVIVPRSAHCAFMNALAWLAQSRYDCSLDWSDFYGSLIKVRLWGGFVILSFSQRWNVIEVIVLFGWWIIYSSHESKLAFFILVMCNIMPCSTTIGFENLQKSKRGRFFSPIVMWIDKFWSKRSLKDLTKKLFVLINHSFEDIFFSKVFHQN